ncbi:MAG: TonB-dependent receptor [Myxococcales bacterium]|nr:TonB-dependent receptor [Myxococcota bacterium]MDW8280073.1 TonB-dependent receptor [Myxococcales bacterium]
MVARALLLLGGMLLPAVPVRAENDKERPEDAGPRIRYEAVVTATRHRSSVFETTRAASVVDRDELRSRPPRTTAEALNDEEGVFIQRTNYAGGSPFVRGLTGQQVLLLVDGIRLNNTTTRTGPNSMLTLIDPYTVEGVEVMRGPGSVLYGSDAVGGVVQVRTRRPAPIAGSEIDLDAGLRGIFASWDESGQGSLSASGRWGRWALDTAFSLRRFGDVRGGSETPEQPLTAYREGNLYLGGGVDLGRGTLVLVYQGTRQYDALRTDRSQPGDLRLLPEVARDLAYLRYAGSFTTYGATLSVTATASYQRQREQQDRLRVLQDRLDRDDNTVDVMGVQVAADADLGRAGHLTAGAEGYFEWVTSLAQRGSISQGPGAPLLLRPEMARYPAGSTAQSAALFLQEEVDLERLLGGGDPQRRGRLRALLGVRGGVNLVGIGRDDRLSRLFPELGTRGIIDARLEAFGVYAGSVHLRYEPLSGLALSGGFASGFRAPNLADFARLGAEGLGFAVPSTGLRPEMAYSAEGGLRVAFRKLEGTAFYSYTLIEDILAATPTSVAGQECARPGGDGTCLERYYGRSNADRAQLHAVEVMARLHLLGGLSVLGTVSYVHGTLERAAVGDRPAGTEPFYKIPPVNGVAAVQLRRPRSVFSFAELSVRWAGAQDRLGQADLDDPRICVPGAPRCEGTPGFAVLSLRGAARLSRMIYVTAAVENLTNASYRYHGSGIDGPGLGASVSLEANY